MSFILEALIRAEHERLQRGTGLPALLALPILPPPGPISAPPAPSRRWSCLAAGMAVPVLAGLLALAWFQPWQHPAPPPISATASPAAPPAAAAPSLLAQAAPAPVPEIAAPQLVAAKTLVTSRVRPYHRSHRKQARLKPRPPVAGTVNTAKTAARPEARVYPIAELPAALQKTAKQIAIAGFANSDGPKERMAIVNNRALREGDTLPGGLRVERIAGDGVVFSLKGYRFIKGR